MNKNYLVGVGVVVALILGFVGLFRHSTVVQTKFGGTSPEIASPYLIVGGVTHWFARGTISQASTTVCSFQSPVATSTLLFASITITSGTTTPLVVDMGKSVSPAATTTLFTSATLASGLQGTLVASTTAGGVNGNSFDIAQTFAPSQFFNVKIGGGNGPLNVLVGSCTAEWVQNS